MTKMRIILILILFIHINFCSLNKYKFSTVWVVWVGVKFFVNFKYSQFRSNRQNVLNSILPI